MSRPATSARRGALATAYDDLEARIAALAEEEELAAIRPDLDGEQIMAILGLKPGREVGEAYRFLSSCASTRASSATRSRATGCCEWWARAAG